jgi:hypothetical protein
MSAADMFWAAPPIARYTAPPSPSIQKATSNANNRTITAAAVLISIPGHIIGVPSLLSMIFIPQYIFTLRMFPQIWRLVTSFLITGPQLGMILDPYFLFTYCSNLETTAARFSQPGDFFVYLVFCAVIILVCRATATGCTLALNSLPHLMRPSRSCLKPNVPPVASPTDPSTRSLISCLSFDKPRISARPANYSCHGSWKRGRLPLHCAARSSFAINPRGAVECGNDGNPCLRKLSTLSRAVDGGFWALHTLPMLLSF